MNEVILFRLPDVELAVDVQRDGEMFTVCVITSRGIVVLQFRELTLPQALHKAADLTEEIISAHPGPPGKTWIIE